MWPSIAGAAALSAGHAGQAESERVRCQNRRAPSRRPRRAACARRAALALVPPAATSSRLAPAAGRAGPGFSSTAVASASPARAASVISGPRVGRTSGSLTVRVRRAGAPMTGRRTMTRPAPGVRARGRRDAASLVIVPAEYSHEPSMQNWDRPPPDIAGRRTLRALAAGSVRGDRSARVRRGRRSVRASISGTGGGAWELSTPTGRAVGRARGTRAARHLDSPVGRRPARRAGRARRGSARPAARRGGRRATCCSPIRATSIWCGRSRGGSRFEIEGRRRRRWAVDVGFGKAGVSAGRPRTTCASTARRSRACARERSRPCRRCWTDA